LKCPNDEIPTPIEVTILTEDFWLAIKKIRESTSSSPSGRHLGHYKAVLTNDELLEMYAQLLMIPFWCGFGLARWKYAIQVMIEKLPGWPWIEKLRIIQLIEVDLNATAKILFAQRLEAKAVANGTLPENQYAQKGYSSRDTLLVKRMMWDLAALICINIIGFNNDAKGCFNCQIPIIAALTCHRQGLPRSVADTFLDVLYGMQYCI
jgi:hypothetical protein